MPISDVVVEIDKEVERLLAAKVLLVGEEHEHARKNGKHHTMSAAARRKIGAATRARWRKLRAAKKNAA